MRRKALFFDVDRTLFSEVTKQVPQSAVLALNKAREDGHRVFINTGRVFCIIGNSSYDTKNAPLRMRTRAKM